MAKNNPGFNSSGNPTTIEIDGIKYDFEKTNKELAEIHGRTPLEMREFRMEHASHTSLNSYRHRELDFSKSNKELSEELGVTENTIRHRRRDYAPQTVRPYKRKQKLPPILKIDTHDTINERTIKDFSDSEIIAEISRRFSKRRDHGLSVISDLLEKSIQLQSNPPSSSNAENKLKLRIVS